MDQIISTGLQMMQIEVSIDKESLCTIRALNTINFDDLHKIICHKLSMTSSMAYSFYLPKVNMTVRKVTRSFDTSATSQLAAYLQTGDTIYYHIYNSEFHLRFSSMGVVDEQTAMQAKLLVTQSKIKHVLKKENIRYINEISAVTQRQLFHLAQLLFQERLYQYFPHKSFLMIHVEDMLQPVYIENYDDQFLLYFFQDEESYRRFVCALKDSLPNQSVYKYKQALVMRFGKTPLATIPFHKCSDTYISFLDMQRGWELDGISEEMAKELLMTFPILLDTIRSMNYRQMQFHDKQGVLHIYNQFNRPLRFEICDFETMVIPVIPYQKQHNIDALIETKIVDTYVEIDYRFIRQSSFALKGERRAYLLNVSAMGPLVQSHYEHLFEKEDNIHHAFLDMLVSIIEENGRPQVIKVRDRYIYSILDDFCSKLGIFVKIEPRLLYLEAYYADQKRVIYNMEDISLKKVNDAATEPIKKAVDEQPLQHQYSRKRYKMKAYFN